MATADEVYGRDLAFTTDFVRSASGDLDTISGLPNLKEAIIRRIMTVPGSVIHRPTYGVGLRNFVNNLNSIGIQQRLAASIREQLLQDPRIEKFLGLRVSESDTTAGLVTIVVRVQPVGYAELSVTVTEGV